MNKHTPPETTKANARLIAAAPDLLRLSIALVRIATIMDTDLTALGKGRDLSGVPGFEGQNLIEAAQSIIRKAKGE